MFSKTLSAVGVALALAISAGAHAQVANPAAEARGADVLSPSQRDAVVAAVKAAYRKSYVFPETVPAILAKLDKAKASGRYNVANASELAGLITADLRAASHDRHAYLSYDPARFAAATSAPAAGGDDALTDFDAARARRAHHGLSEMRILPGNVRYLRISLFHWISDETGQAYDDAMRFLKGGDAVIIDLRGNGGGASEAVQYLVSHFLKPGTLEITFLESGHEPVQTRVLDNLPAGRMVGKPLYVLTDGGTGSAAESFAYDVQQFKIGKLVGETTAGAANNNEFTPISPGFMLSVSTGRPMHAVSKANWEGAGVSPDVTTPSARALDQAMAMALTDLAANHPAEEAKADYAWALAEIRARLQPPTVAPSVLAAAPGRYGPYVVTAEPQGLMIARPGHPLWPMPRRLQPLTSEGLFAVEGIEMLRIALKPAAIELWWKDEAAPRTLPRS